MEKVIGVKEFLKNFSKVAEKVQKGQSFVVVKHLKPLFCIGPTETTPKKKFTLADFQKLQTKSKGNKSVSRDIDKILYGGKV